MKRLIRHIDTIQNQGGAALLIADPAQIVILRVFAFQRAIDQKGLLHIAAICKADEGLFEAGQQAVSNEFQHGGRLIGGIQQAGGFEIIQCFRRTT